VYMSLLEFGLGPRSHQPGTCGYLECPWFAVPSADWSRTISLLHIPTHTRGWPS